MMKRAVEEIRPLLSNHFNLTVKMPLKAVNRGYAYAISPIRRADNRRRDYNESSQRGGLKLQPGSARRLRQPRRKQAV
jgi:hypothetical protein